MALSEIVSGLRGGVAFLTRIPVESGEDDWHRFQSFPAAFPVVGYLVGAFAALPFLVFTGVPAAFGYLLALVVLTGFTHLDGVADMGDAAAVHDIADRFSVLKDTTTGAGGVVGVAVVVAGLALAGVGLAGLPIAVAMGIVVAAEVGAKLGMATVACIGTASHDGLGAGFTRNADTGLLVGPAIAAAPAVVLSGLSPAAFAAIATGPAVAIAVVSWSDEHLGGVSGDVFGTVNELGRVVALHVAVVTWTAF